MNPSLFSVAVADVERDEQQRTWDIPLAWLSWALADSEAEGTSKTGRLTASLMKSGSQFMVRGQIRVQVQLPCARTLDPVVYDLAPELFLMLTREPGATTSTERPRRRTRNSPPEDAEEPLLSDEDAANDVFRGETIQLDKFVREQVLLELPMFPLRSDLRLGEATAIGAPPRDPPEPPVLDPRLAPLQALAEKLKAQSTEPRSNQATPNEPTASKPPSKK
jgi:uncharacterized protein